jgi:SpoVK/Ycf46/Vps4 family AAA+-type ATPase
MIQTLSESIQELTINLAAGYAFFYCQSDEINRNVELIHDCLEEFNQKNPTKTWEVQSWDFETDMDPEVVQTTLDGDPTGDADRIVMIAKNWNWFMSDQVEGINKNIISWVMNRESLYTMVDSRRALIIIGNESFDKAIPEEVKRLFLPLEFSLPDKNEIETQYDFMIESAKQNPNFKIPSKKNKKEVIAAAKGMTLNEITNSFAYSIIKTGGELDPLIVSERKAAEVEKIAGVKIGRYSEKLEDLQGYDLMSKFVLGTIDSDLAKGIIILGPGGTGKTMFARAIGATVRRLVFELELAELFGGIVGDTERNVREALKFITANTPCILFIDEIEKGLAGAAGNKNGGSTDDVARRAMSQLLKWLSDARPEGVYVIATCNDISSLDPEWIRPGRWDSAPFFVNLPASPIRKDIWSHYCKVHKLECNTVKLVDDNGWTGAEIESCCRIASMMNTSVQEASKFVIPISVTAAEKVKALVTWAENKTIQASSITEPKKKKGIQLRKLG